MILTAASTLYGAVASWRRRYYAPGNGRSRRLTRPVISIGNLTTGGTGKTPVVACLARLLLARGERPAILTRGYGRPSPADGVTVVSDGSSILARFDRSGDEPLMLARALPGVPVLVGADRYLSGRLAETRFGATVHLLDDGFQHVALARDIDLLLADADVLSGQVLPAGRLREPLAAAAAADAVLTTVRRDDGEPIDPRAVAGALHVAAAFAVQRRIEAMPADLGMQPVLAVAGIARPERFFADLVAAGWPVAGTLAFRDHHRFTQRDRQRITAAAARAGAGLVATTEKDAVRLDGADFGQLRLRAVPLTARIEPAAAFADWLFARLDRSAAAARRAAAGTLDADRPRRMPSDARSPLERPDQERRRSSAVDGIALAVSAGEIAALQA